MTIRLPCRTIFEALYYTYRLQLHNLLPIGKIITKGFLLCNILHIHVYENEKYGVNVRETTFQPREINRKYFKYSKYYVNILVLKYLSKVIKILFIMIYRI